MRLRRIDLVFIIGAGLVVAFVALLPSPRENNPPVPATSEHLGVRQERECLTCHVRNGSRPLASRHPKRPDCFRCHRELPMPGTRVETH